MSQRKDWYAETKHESFEYTQELLSIPRPHQQQNINILNTNNCEKKLRNFLSKCIFRQKRLM